MSGTATKGYRQLVGVEEDYRVCARMLTRG